MDEIARHSRDLDEQFPKHEQLLTSEIRDREAIPDSIKDFLGTGK